MPIVVSGALIWASQVQELNYKGTAHAEGDIATTAGYYYYAINLCSTGICSSQINPLIALTRSVAQSELVRYCARIVSVWSLRFGDGFSDGAKLLSFVLGMDPTLDELIIF